MEINVQKGNILEADADLVAVGVFEEDGPVGGHASKINKALGGKLAKIANAKEFEGKAGQKLVLTAPAQYSADSVLVIGLGKREEADMEVVRDAAGSVLKTARSMSAQTAAVEMFYENEKDVSVTDVGRAMAEAVVLGLYSFNKYKQENPRVEIKEMKFIVEDGRNSRHVKRGVRSARSAARATNTARDLVNTPAKDMTPETLAEKAWEIVKNSDGMVQVKVFAKKQCQEMGMNAYLAVAQGSKQEPRFIHLTYKPKGKAKSSVALVGKGVTFDSGGLSIKSSSGMETMKCDMAGAAAVLGVFSALSDLKPKVEVHGVIAATENMPSGDAIKPGDVVRASNGKSIEILNTDAEGRLTLADAIPYAAEQDPEYIIDMATLTGACVVGLGEEIAAVMTNDAKFGNMILNEASAAGEKMWEMPLEPRYKKLLESDIADLRNTATSRYGGSLTAGLFLREFVPEGTTWAHLDIAGPAFAERSMATYLKKGATGFSVRTLLRLISNL